MAFTTKKIPEVIKSGLSEWITIPAKFLAYLGFGEGIDEIYITKKTFPVRKGGIHHFLDMGSISHIDVSFLKLTIEPPRIAYGLREQFESSLTEAVLEETRKLSTRIKLKKDQLEYAGIKDKCIFVKPEDKAIVPYIGIWGENNWKIYERAVKSNY